LTLHAFPTILLFTLTFVLGSLARRVSITRAISFVTATWNSTIAPQFAITTAAIAPLCKGEVANTAADDDHQPKSYENENIKNRSFHNALTNLKPVASPDYQRNRERKDHQQRNPTHCHNIHERKNQCCKMFSTLIIVQSCAGIKAVRDLEDEEPSFSSTIGKLQLQSIAMSMKQDDLTETAIATIDFAERLESVKAGLLGAVTGSLVFGAAMLTNRWLLAPCFKPLALLQMDVDTVAVLISGAIAALSGFLFGVAYRYIIRQDQNPHLKAGAVLAFGLVRGLAIADGKFREPSALLPLLVLGTESMLLFAGARVLLDWALLSGWIKPFGVLTVETSDAPANLSLSSPYSVKSSNSG